MHDTTCSRHDWYLCSCRVLYSDKTCEERLLSQFSNSFIRQHLDFVFWSELPVHTPAAALDCRPVQNKVPSSAKSVARPASKPSSMPEEVPS